MKAVAVIFLVTLMSSTQTPVGQLFKLPLLIEHFIKHQNQKSLSLLAFLEEHYISEHRDADMPEDERLPFKTIILFTMGSAIVPEVVKAGFCDFTTAEKKVILPQVYSSQQHLSSM